ncbi:Carbohydrate-selective porin, OprB family [Planctomycetes bacterium Pan216]|uniref:Carbohydrate-selective porin, OprB family n=1 Tax=Kolteria novifilia TaxID=2527975 RepID=A0A518AZ09_9BACT|nr:Carbohydrate-selective porin, OprB family [Planctomycetes bacterium Pan216]
MAPRRESTERSILLLTALLVLPIAVLRADDTTAVSSSSSHTASVPPGNDTSQPRTTGSSLPNSPSHSAQQYSGSSYSKTRDDVVRKEGTTEVGFVQPDVASGLINRVTGIEKYGVEAEVRWAMSWNAVFFGGLLPGNWADENVGEVKLIGDLDTMFGWKGGTAQIRFLHRRGSDASALTGDLLTFNGYDNLNQALGELNELWVQQDLFEERFSVLVGKVKINRTFQRTQSATLFLGNDYEALPAISAFLPQNQSTTSGIQGFVRPNDQFFAGFGFYDGRLGAQGINTGARGPQFNGNYFYIGETGVRYTLGSNDLPGRFLVGGWGQSGKLSRFDGGVQNGTAGFFLIHEQTIWQEQEHPDQNLAAFFSWSTGDGNVNPFVKGLTAGLQWIGPIPRRDEDVFGFGLVWAQLTPVMGSASESTQSQLAPRPLPPPFNNDRITANEWEWQWYYWIFVHESLKVQPNLTYIHDPGLSTEIRDPLVFTINVLLDF